MPLFRIVPLLFIAEVQVLTEQIDDAVADLPFSGKGSRGHAVGAAVAVDPLVVTLAAIGVTTAQPADAAS